MVKWISFRGMYQNVLLDYQITHFFFFSFPCPFPFLSPFFLETVVSVNVGTILEEVSVAKQLCDVYQLIERFSFHSVPNILLYPTHETKFKVAISITCRPRQSQGNFLLTRLSWLLLSISVLCGLLHPTIFKFSIIN